MLWTIVWSGLLSLSKYPVAVLQCGEQNLSSWPFLQDTCVRFAIRGGKEIY